MSIRDMVDSIVADEEEEESLEGGDDLGGMGEGLEDTSGESSDDGGGGTSFEDLRDESGEADWEEDREPSDFDDSGFEGASESDAVVEQSDEFEDRGEDLGNLSDETIEETPAQETTQTTEEPQTTQSTQESAASDGKPYIATLPDGFVADLIVVEWLEFLVSETGVRQTSKALNYYESVDWISEAVTTEMEEYLRGFQETGRGSLAIDHHKQSLEFINQVNYPTLLAHG